MRWNFVDSEYHFEVVKQNRRPKLGTFWDIFAH